MVYYTSDSGINNHIIREILHDIGLRDDIIHRFITITFHTELIIIVTVILSIGLQYILINILME